MTTSLTGDGVSRTYVQGVSYDAQGRPEIRTYPSTLPVKTVYNARGYVSSLRPQGGGTPFISISGTNAFGQVSGMTFSNGVTTALGYDPITGLLETPGTGTAGNNVQDESYRWQSNGILEERQRKPAATLFKETFEHDGLNRLEGSRNYAGAALKRTLDQAYDKRGNLLTKTSSAGADANITAYSYGTDKNRLNSVTIGTAAYTLNYNDNGAVTHYDKAGAGDDKFISWNGRQLPTAFTIGNSVTDTTPTARDEFRYGPDGHRFYKKSTWDDNGTLRTEHTFYVGSFEALIPDPALSPGVAEIQKTLIGGSVLQVRTVQTGGGASSVFETLHRDPLGSVEVVTNGSGSIVRDFAFDPFGERRLVNGNRMLNASETEQVADDLRVSSTQGYTGHENLDRTGFVHMNGRVYDPELGRFISPDPIVQAPGYSQSWNRFAYVMNSPVSANDPSGYETAWSSDGENSVVGGTLSTVAVPVTTTTHTVSPGNAPAILVRPETTAVFHSAPPIPGYYNGYQNGNSYRDGYNWTNNFVFMDLPSVSIHGTGDHGGSGVQGGSAPPSTARAISHTEKGETDQSNYYDGGTFFVSAGGSFTVSIFGNHFGGDFSIALALSFDSRGPDAGLITTVGKPTNDFPLTGNIGVDGTLGVVRGNLAEIDGSGEALNVFIPTPIPAPFGASGSRFTDTHQQAVGGQVGLGFGVPLGLSSMRTTTYTSSARAGITDFLCWVFSDC